MRLWQPDPTEPVLLEWYRPLLAASARARAADVPWPIYAEEFDFLGRADRARDDAVWVYRHRVNGGLICADSSGRTYRYLPYRSGPARGRFTEIEARRAVWAAGLPDVVDPVWYEPPRERPAAISMPSMPDTSSAHPVWRGKRHLRVVPDPTPA